MKVNVLNTVYDLDVVVKDEELLKENADGLCHTNDKEIKVRSIDEYSARTSDGKKNRMKHVILHELVHAYAEESGVSYDEDEKLVDWIAKMLPHIYDNYTIICGTLIYEGKM